MLKHECSSSKQGMHIPVVMLTSNLCEKNKRVIQLLETANRTKLLGSDVVDYHSAASKEASMDGILSRLCTESICKLGKSLQTHHHNSEAAHKSRATNLLLS